MRLRIIPALAGNTDSSVAVRCGARDHPRSRGEYLTRAEYVFGEDGSSPLSRGILGQFLHAAGGFRIIPALAGNTRGSVGDRFRRRDHPRSRGEYTSSPHPKDQKNGSSPLSRGIRFILRFRRDPVGIIPALAGNTLVDKGFYQLDLSDLGNPLLARLRFSKSLAPRLRRPPSWRGESSGSSPEGPGRTIRVSPS